MRCPRTRERGTSILELLVAMAVLMVAFSIAGDLLLESSRRMTRELLRSADPVYNVLERLRADIRMSGSAVVLNDPDGPYPMLRLDDHPAGRIEWRRTLGDLARRVVDDDGSSEEAALLRRVNGWTPVVFSGDARDLVIAEITVRSFELTELRQGAAQAAVHVQEDRTVRCVASLRIDMDWGS